MSHVAHTNEACPTSEWVMSHIWVSHVAHTNQSCPTDERVMSHRWTSHVTHMVESCLTYERVMLHIWTSHVTQMHESCHTYERVMSHIWTSHITQMNVSLARPAQSPHDSFICVTHDICVMWLVHMCDMTRSYVWHITRMNVSRIVRPAQSWFLISDVCEKLFIHCKVVSSF